MQIIKKVKLDYLNIGLLIGAILFYLSWYFIDGIQLSNDSTGYINMSLSREAMYVLFLSSMRSLFGENNYLHIVIIIQSMIAGYAMWKVVWVVKKYSGSKYVLPIGATIIQIAVVLLCRFIASRQACYSNEIATEGLSISIFLLFIIQLFLVLKERKRRNIILLFVLSILLVNIRKQLIITFGIMAMVFTIYCFIREIKVKVYLKLLLLIFLSFMVSNTISKIYSYSISGEFIGQTKKYESLLNNTLYTSDIEDIKHFDDEVKVIASELIQQVVDLGLNKFANQDKTLIGSYQHYENSYDKIGYGIVNVKVEEYVRENYQLDQLGIDLKIDEINGKIAKTLLKDNGIDMIQVAFNNAIIGMVNSVAKVTMMGIIYTFLIIVSYVLLFCLIYRKHKITNSILFAFIVGCSIIVNVGAVSITIFAQNRYMLYNMPLFYIAIIWMLYDCRNLLIDTIKKVK